MKSKKLILGVCAIIAIAVIAGFLIQSMTPSTAVDDVTSEEIDELLDDLEDLEDIELELDFGEEDLDIDF